MAPNPLRLFEFQASVSKYSGVPQPHPTQSHIVARRLQVDEEQQEEVTLAPTLGPAGAGTSVDEAVEKRCPTWACR